MKRQQRPSERKPSFGTVISGTFRNEDLIPAFLAELEEYAPRQAKKLVKDFNTLLAEEEFDWGSNEADDLLSALIDALSEVASRVPYCYFGSHPADGSDYGFWPSWNEYQDDVLYWQDDGRNPTRAELDGYYFYTRVSDHGNITLYNKAYRPVWSIV